MTVLSIKNVVFNVVFNVFFLIFYTIIVFCVSKLTDRYIFKTHTEENLKKKGIIKVFGLLIIDLIIVVSILHLIYLIIDYQQRIFPITNIIWMKNIENVICVYLYLEFSSAGTEKIKILRNSLIDNEDGLI
tara:strand:+ start:764 stop:1156 length:393 start_codon:yes stop_codon:yes gene_type:complete